MKLRKFYKFISILLLLAVIVPVLICDSFVVEGNSMLPTLHDGERIYVNKLAMGARIYTSYDFDNPRLECFRLPGFRKIRVGDIAVFNYPYARDTASIQFLINYVYVKRCIGCPGDTVRIDNGYYRNSNNESVGVPESLQRLLSETPDSTLKEFPTDLFKNFGPVYVPGKGDTVTIDTTNLLLFAPLIEYETGIRPGIDRCGENYVFGHNYYFFAGDNIIRSQDSRHFGLVPEEYIIGIKL